MKYSMIKGSIWKSIFFFSMPILGGLLLQQLYSTVDGIIVGNFVSSTALGAIGTCGPVTSLLIAVASGFSTGFGIVFAQFYGAGDDEKLHKCYGTIMVIMLAIGLIFTLIGLFAGKFILATLLSVPEETLAMATTYIRIYSLGMIFQMVYNALSAALRSMGNSGSTMLFLLLSTGVNIVLDLVFVVAFHWAVAGAAIATVIAQGISVAAALIYIRRRYPELSKSKLRVDRELAILITKLGIPSALQTSALSLGSLGLQRLINSFGTSMMEAYTAANRIENFICMPIISFNIAISTFTGQNIGAGQMDRVKKGLAATMAIGVIFVGVLATAVGVFAKPLVGLFGCTGRALELGQSYLVFMACVLILFLVLFVIKGLLAGAGDVTVPMIITVVSMAARLVFAYIAAKYIAEAAIWYSMIIDFVSGTVLMLLRYLGGRWKEKAVVNNN